MKLELDVAFEIGESVEYDSKIGKDAGKITAYSFRQGSITYEVTWSDKKPTWHYDFELISKKQGK